MVIALQKHVLLCTWLPRNTSGNLKLQK